MSEDEGTRLSRRAVCAAIGLVMLSVSAPRLALAQDPAGALRDLSQSSDFRVRVSAALYLGRTKPLGAREALEGALGDAHPAVRAAAASALAALGDPLAITALARRLGSESSASVKAQIQSSIEQLRRGVAVDQGGAQAHVVGRRLESARHVGQKALQDLFLLYSDHASVRASHADVSLDSGTSGQHLLVGGWDVGVSAEYGGHASLQIPTQRELL